ncbi:ABC transporter substrate-binding protein [Yinghuangia sp. ASG 101]|uniref:ABC transporter substrate-binding protein n=1 Tax=Yinghuangia sp. ASG 101 TaxID=2896848 RepID=UPI001E3B9B95|nr:ABC transporter substrate-binding protein [Yinghuangia sp. ASG 101]UGQ14208.1 ABC transporter substrate-binding protein [Yinghuangia sp. ASG 101]
MIQALRSGDPDEVGGYRVIARLGAGGMGQVFLGRSASGRLVAVKVVRAELSDDPDFRTRFRREVDASRRVSAFHTAAVVAADANATPAWMVTEYIPGPSVEEAVRRHGPFPVAALRVLGAGLAEALEAIHACGLIHRDLKPSNILLAEDGPRVIDFGIVRATEGATVTQTGYMVGSVGFLSPEQLNSERVSPAADVFALGAVLCSAAGLSPFGGGSAQAMLYRVVHTQANLQGLPDELRDIVAACLAKDPGARPRPAELLDLLSTPGPSMHWLPEGVVSSIAERREHAHQVALLALTDVTADDVRLSPFAPGAHAPPSEPSLPDSEASAKPAWMAAITGITDATAFTGTGAPHAGAPDTTGFTGVTAGGPVDATDADHTGAPTDDATENDASAVPTPDSAPGARGGSPAHSGSGPSPGLFPPHPVDSGAVSPYAAPQPPYPGSGPGRFPPPGGSGGAYPTPYPFAPPPPASPSMSSGTPLVPWSTPYGAPLMPLQPATPPHGARLDRLPGGRRVWLPAIIVTVLAVLAGAGIAVARMMADDGGRAHQTSGPPPTSAAPRKGGTLTVSINSDSATLDPFSTFYTAYGDGQRMAALYDPLVVFVQSTGKVEPHLAKSLTSTPDGYTWSLELRPNVRFSDGTPFDAEAVKFNWQRHGDPSVKSAHANAVRGLTMRVVSPTRLDITLPYPDKTFDHLIADELTYIGSPTAIRANPQGFAKQPIGAGPFKLESWTKGEKQVFVRNPDYWQGPDLPLLDSLVFRVETQQPVAPVIDGSADVNFQSALRDLQQARSAGLELTPSVNTGGVLLGFNSAEPPFDDARARRAVALALDPKALAEEAGVTTTPTRTVVPSTSPLRTDALPQQPAPDTAKAQKLFDELAAEGTPVSFKVSALEGERRIMEGIRTQLSKFGNVTMDFDLLSSSDFNTRFAHRDFEAIWGYEAGADLDTWLFALTRSGYDANYLGYRNTAVDRAWDNVRSAATDQQKTAAYTAILRELADDPPWWLFAEISVYAVHRKGTVSGLDGAYADGILRWERVGKT